MLQMLEHAENVRRDISPKIESRRKSNLGQFMTPSPVARFMADIFTPTSIDACRLLDAGAGVGSLSCAFLDRWAAGNFGFKHVDAFAYEFDDTLRAHLKTALSAYSSRLSLREHVSPGDFIERAVGMLERGEGGFTHAILNPPYKKINSDSRHRMLLRQAGIETVNLYSAFVALAVALMAHRGQVVAIIPRSFCNGPYYKPFRDFILKRAAIRRIHLFGARNKAFKDDGVLQENIILVLERGGKQREVVVSTSTDDSFRDLEINAHPFERIVFPDHPDRFIHVPTTTQQNAIDLSPGIRYSIGDLGIKISTGPVVDFRVKEHLRDMPELRAVPLLYPGHIANQRTEWPKPNLRKPNAIACNEETKRWLYANGFYCVVRRFSAKEEKRRIVAGVVNPNVFDGAAMLGFENHLNVYHDNKNGLPEMLARGLVVFLNTSAVDEHFRRFSGHTQVNATDLKLMKYPSREILERLGAWAKKQKEMTQEMIDTAFERFVT